MLVVRFDTTIVVKLISSEEDDSGSLEDELDVWCRGIEESLLFIFLFEALLL